MHLGVGEGTWLAIYVTVYKTESLSDMPKLNYAPECHAYPVYMTLTSEHRSWWVWMDKKSPNNCSNPSIYALWRELEHKFNA